MRVEAGVDVTSDDDVLALARRLDGVVLDELVVQRRHPASRTISRASRLDDVRAQLEVNAIAPLARGEGASRRASARRQVALITSRMGSIADNGSGGYYGYRMSKAALNAAGMSLARDLREAGIAVAILHPGFVRTHMTEHTGNVEPAEAAKQLVARIDALTLETSGTFWHANGQTLPW